MKREEKRSQVEVLKREFENSLSTVLVDYKGLNVAEITELRNKLREASVDFKVVKNTLSKIAAKGTAIDKMSDCFTGPTATVIGKADPVAGIKVLDEYIKTNPKLEFKAAIVEGALISKTDIPQLAKLPSKEVLMGLFLGTLQAPVASFVRVMAGNMTGLLNVLNGIKDSKE